MNLINKAKSVWSKHKDSIIFGLCIVGGIMSGAILVKAIIEMPSRNYVRNVEPANELPSDPPVINWYHYSCPDDKYEWDDEKYKDDWEKLSIAANYLDLEEGESYVISSVDGFIDDQEAVNIGNVYMSHYIDDIVVNPPEEDEDEDDEDEDDEDEDDEDEEEDDEEEKDEDEDEDDCEEFRIKVPKDADDDVRKIVEEFVSFIENGDIEIERF